MAQGSRNATREDHPQPLQPHRVHWFGLVGHRERDGRMVRHSNGVGREPDPTRHDAGVRALHHGRGEPLPPEGVGEHQAGC